MERPNSRKSETKIWEEVEYSFLKLEQKRKILNRLRESNQPLHKQLFIDSFLK